MKRLALSTVKKAFTKIGFEQWDHCKGMSLSLQISPNSRLYLTFYPQITITDARWKNRPNVHIVSYWGFPHTLKELNTIISDIKYVYSELCNTTFPLTNTQNPAIKKP